MSFSVIDIGGIVGAGLILLGFVRVNSGRWSGKSMWYELDNFVGAALLAVYSFDKGAYPNLVLNVVWSLAALHGLESLWERNKKHKEKR